MNVKYKAKNNLSIRCNNSVFTLLAGAIVTATQRNGNKKVLVIFDDNTTEWVDASWFINNFEGVPI